MQNINGPKTGTIFFMQNTFWFIFDLCKMSIDIKMNSRAQNIIMVLK